MHENEIFAGDDPDAFKERYSAILGKISDAAKRSGRADSGIEVMAVTKFHPLSSMIMAYRAGVRRFGENRVQEAQMKQQGFREHCPAASLEMLGHLQSNKIGKATRIFDRIQSVDSLDLLVGLSANAESEGKKLGILLELHVAEDSKTGFRDREELLEACDFMAGRKAGYLIPSGLMAMAPISEDEAPVRRAFSECRESFDEIRKRFGFPSFTTLSMGMSDDFLIAVEEGSSLVRIGTALFGRRLA